MVAIQPKQEDHQGLSCLNPQCHHDDRMNTKRLLAVVCAASIPALLFGYYLAIIYATVYAPEEVKRSPQPYMREQGMLFMEFGAAITGVLSLIGSFQDVEPLALLFLCDVLLLVVLPFMSAYLANGSPDDMPGQSAGLLCLGFAGAFVLIFLTGYISEISPSAIRGALVSTVFLQISGGQILYHLFSWISSSTPHETRIWHWLIATILPIMHIIVIIPGWLPESPRWLYQKGHFRQAEESLKMMRSSCEVSKEVTAMELSLVEEVDIAEMQQENKLKFLDVIWLYKVLGRRIIVGFGSLVAQQFVGISMLMRYSYAIFHLTTNRYNTKTVNGNADNIMSTVSSSEIPLITSSLVLVGTLFCTILVDRFGRRRLLLVSISGIISSLGLLSLLFYIGSSSAGGIVYSFSNTNLGDANRDFWYNTDEERTSCMGLLALLALAMYIVFHSLGIGTVPWIINSEIYPTKYRTICLAVANLVYWCSKMAVQDFLFDNLGQYLSVAQMLFLFCLFSAIVGLFIHFYIPETKRLQLEDVEKILLEEEKCIKMDNCPREDEELKDVIIAR